MTRTLTSGPAYLAAVPARAVPTGIVAVPFSWSAAGQSISVSDLVQLAKIPHGATITGLRVAAWSAAADGFTARLGLSNLSADYFVASGAYTATATGEMTVRAGALPYKVSLSADAAVQHVFLQLLVTAATSQTASAVVKGIVEYTMDGL